MKNSDIFYNFISTEIEADFEKKKKEYNRLTAPVILNQVKTLTGELNVTVTKEKEIYFENIKDYVDLNEEILQKITKAYKALLMIMSQASDKMKELSILWKQVNEKSIKYNDYFNTAKTYDILGKMMSTWAETEGQQIDILNVYVREYFRYIKNEYHSMNDMAQVVEARKSIYKKALEKLDNTKENLFKQQDLTQWGLSQNDLDNNKMALLKNKEFAFSKMLPKDTKRVNMFKAFYGGYLNSIIGEYERLRSLNSKRHKDALNVFIKKLTDCMTNYHVSLADRLMEFREMKDFDSAPMYQNNIINEQHKNVSNEVKDFFDEK